MNFLASASLESSSWKLKSLESSETSGHNTVVSSQKSRELLEKYTCWYRMLLRIRRTIDDHKLDYPAMRR